MKFTIEITCDNAAFEQEPQDELVRILELIQQRLKNEGLSFATIINTTGNPDVSFPTMTLWDTNGNKVGVARCIQDD